LYLPRALRAVGSAPAHANQDLWSIRRRRNDRRPVMRRAEEKLWVNGISALDVHSATGRAPTTRSESVRVFVLPPGARFGGLGFRRSLEKEVVVRSNERVGS